MEETHFIEIFCHNGKYIGHKNIDCPDYEKCLNKAVIRDRSYWICNNCENEFKFKPLSLSEIELYEADDETTNYLPEF